MAESKEDIKTYIPDAPLQTKLRKSKDYLSKDYQYKYVANSRVDFYGRVLAVRKYWRDDKSEIAPFDLALGWLDMSKAEIIRKLRFTQSDRKLHTDPWDMMAPNDPRVSMNFANMHIIPAERKVLNVLDDIEKYDIVKIDGYLVDVRGVNKEYVWNSSRTRSDIGRHSNEIVYITDIRIIKPPIKCKPELFTTSDHEKC